MPSWLSWEEQEVRGSEIYPDFTAVSAVAVPHPFLPLLMILWPRSESVLNHQVSPLSTAALPSLADTSRLTVLKQQPEWCQKLKLDRVTHPLNTAVVPNHRAKVKVCSIACKVLYYFSPWCDPLPPLPENSSLKEEGLTSLSVQEKPSIVAGMGSSSSHQWPQSRQREGRWYSTHVIFISSQLFLSKGSCYRLSAWVSHLS